MSDETPGTTPSGLPEGEKTMSLPEVLELAAFLQNSDLLDDAEELYEIVLNTIPDQPDALHFLGVVKHRKGRTRDGIQLIERAIALVPDHADMHNNLGNLIRSVDGAEAAEAAYRRAIQLAPDHVDALNNLGIIHKDRDHFEDAEKTFRRVLRLQPDKVEALLNLASLMRKRKRYDEAIELYNRANELTPFDPATVHQLARVYRLTGRDEQARDLYRKWLEHEPDNPEARHMLAASTGNDAPERASDAYVRNMFDSFAESFDLVLRKIGYRAPFYVRDAVLSALGEAEDRYDILDAGCGTGLCGALLERFARRMEGVDLSPAMIERARDRGVYDAVHVGELTDFMAGAPGRFDIVASADTLCYFGRLEGVLAAAATALRPGGLLVFTLERHDERSDEEGFRLHPHGRYSHGAAYVSRCLEGAGLAPNEIREDILRQEGGEPVHGLVVSATKAV